MRRTNPRGFRRQAARRPAIPQNRRGTRGGGAIPAMGVQGIPGAPGSVNFLGQAKPAAGDEKKNIERSQRLKTAYTAVDRNERDILAQFVTLSQKLDDRRDAYGAVKNMKRDLQDQIAHNERQNQVLKLMKAKVKDLTDKLKASEAKLERMRSFLTETKRSTPVRGLR